MKTELDLAMDRTFTALTSEGGMFQTVMTQRFGRDVPMIAAAPSPGPPSFNLPPGPHLPTRTLPARIPMPPLPRMVPLLPCRCRSVSAGIHWFMRSPAPFRPRNA